MKKLMIAAAVAAMGIGYAEAGCKDGPAPAGAPAAVYQWQFKGKVGTGVVLSKTGGATTCVDGTTNVEAIRVPGSLAIQAYTYICDDECQLIGSNFAAPTKAEYYATKPFKSAVYRTNFITAIDFANVIGKTGSQYELCGNASFVFSGNDPQGTIAVRFAGFGSYDKKNSRPSAVSGNFAGTILPPRYNGRTTVNNRSFACPEADYWLCDQPGVVAAGNPNSQSAAYGTWSVKYNSAASKKLAANQNYWVK